ncbi:hypothetical protein Tco_0612719, partial [Tanacetum coccineum]
MAGKFLEFSGGGSGSDNGAGCGFIVSRVWTCGGSIVTGIAKPLAIFDLERSPFHMTMGGSMIASACWIGFCGGGAGNGSGISGKTMSKTKSGLLEVLIVSKRNWKVCLDLNSSGLLMLLKVVI